MEIEQDTLVKEDREPRPDSAYVGWAEAVGNSLQLLSISPGFDEKSTSEKDLGPGNGRSDG